MEPEKTTSIVDYLKGTGQESSFAARTKLAQQYGISNYVGLASQNTQLLNLLRSQEPTQPTVAPTAPTAPTTQNGGTYSVQSGDTLSSIAARQGTTVQALLSANPQITDPNLIYAGSTINLPGTTPAPTPTGATQPPVPQTEPPIPPSIPPSPPSPPAPKVPQTPEAEDIAAQITTTTQQIQDSQAQQEALAEYGLTDTDELAMNEKGEYVPKAEVESDEQLSQLGLGSATGSLTLDQVIDKVSDAFGLDDIKTEITDLNDQYSQDVLEVNDNPWLSEAERSKQVKLLTDKYETKKEGLYERMGQENNMIGQALNLYNQEQNRKQQMTISSMNIRANQLKQDEYDTPYYDEQGNLIQENLTTGKIDVIQKAPDTYSQYYDEQGNFVQKNNRTGDINILQKADDIDTDGKVSQYAIETKQNVVDAADDLLDEISGWTTGPGGVLLKNIPGTAAANFDAKLDTLKSNIAFGALVAMREASKTGGALGQVSDREGQLLQASLGALDIKQSPESYKENLTKIRDSVQRWLDEVERTQGGQIQSESDFSYLANDITFSEDGNTAYLPRSVWADVQDKDALLEEAKADGYELLITE